MNELTNLQISEVSLVDEGANPEADVMLFKRKNSGGNELDGLIKRLTIQIEKVEESELRKTAEKYEILGESADNLVKALKQAKAAGNYETVIKLLDTTLKAVESSGVFHEMGKSGAGSTEVSVEKLAARFQKSEPNLSWRQALDKAYRQVLGRK